MPCNPLLDRWQILAAIHVSTALFFAPHTDSPVVVCTFDKTLWDTAKRAGLAVGFAVLWGMDIRQRGSGDTRCPEEHAHGRSTESVE